MNIYRTTTLLLMTTSLAAACGPPQDAGPGAASPAPEAVAPEGAFTWEAHETGSGARRYRLFVPATYRRTAPAPLVVMLHGCTQDPDNIAGGTRLNAAAARAGALVVYPEQTASHNPQKCWNWYDPAHQAPAQGEPAILAGITQHVMAMHNIDPRRVYVAGVSAGGAMAVNLAVSYPDLFAAVGVHSGVPYRAASNVGEALAVMKAGPPMESKLTAALRAAVGDRRLPALIAFHGATDPVVSARNSEGLLAQWQSLGGMGERVSERLEMGGYHVNRTRVGTALELWMIDELGHAWSGGSPEGTFIDQKGPDATAEMMRFFRENARR